MVAIDPQQPPPSTWESLPRAVLGRCLLEGTPSDRGAAFSACISFTKAIFSTASETHVRVCADDCNAGCATVLRWAAECQANLSVSVWSRQGRRALQPLLRFFAQNGVLLPSAVSLYCGGMLLDGHFPAVLSTVFPNLEELTLSRCLADMAMLPLQPLTACSKLRRLQLFGSPAAGFSPAEQDSWLLQLQQVASLPSLTSITLEPNQCPASFLAVAAPHLTELELRSAAPAAAAVVWSAAIGHAAQCTSIRLLKLPWCTARDLCTIVPSLLQLQELSLLRLSSPTAAYSDAVISALCSAPHLTRITCPQLPEPQHSYADRPCSWRDIGLLEQASPQLLARLPLHSLTHPLQFQRLHFRQGTLLTEVRVAADNIARSQAPQPVVLPLNVTRPFCIKFNIGRAAQAASYAQLLHASGPLLPQDATDIRVFGCDVDAATVIGLQHAAPPTLKCLWFLPGGSFEACAWPQLARSFPQLDKLLVGAEYYVTAEEVMGYFRAVLERGQGVPTIPRLTYYVDDGLYREEGEQWYQLIRQLKALGFEDPIDVGIRSDEDDD